MNVLATHGVGIDIVDVERVARLIGVGDRFVSRWFTPDEASYCRARHRPELHFAGRLAAKEAVLKSLKGSWDRPVWREIEVIAGGGGAPTVALHGSTASFAEQQGVVRVEASIAHIEHYAVATATSLLQVRCGPGCEPGPAVRPR